jgi:hypothetical protein
MLAATYFKTRTNDKKDLLDDHPKVEIYTQWGCPYCVRAKALLDSKGVAYTEIDVTMDTAKRREMVERNPARAPCRRFSSTIRLWAAATTFTRWTRGQARPAAGPVTWRASPCSNDERDRPAANAATIVDAARRPRPAGRRCCSRPKCAA